MLRSVLYCLVLQGERDIEDQLTVNGGIVRLCCCTKQ